MIDLGALCALVSSFSAAAVVVLSVLWMKRLRKAITLAIAENANQQVLTAQRLTDALAQVQKQQKNYEQQLQNLSQANVQLRQGLVNLVTRLESNQADQSQATHTVH